MSTKSHTILLVLLFCVAGFFATYHLTESPPVWYDEGMFTQAAINLAFYGQTGLRVAPDIIEPSSKLITVGYPLIYPLAGWFKIFGTGILSARALMVVFILGFLFASYLFARRLFHKDVALGALALLITLPTLYGNGKSVLGEVPGLMYLVLFLVCLNIALSHTARKYVWFLLPGLFAGLCVATKPTFLVLLPAIVIGIFIGWRQKKLRGKEILITVAAGVVPLMFWLFLQFRAGDLLASILSYYVNPYQIPDIGRVIIANSLNLFTSVGPLYLMGIMGVWLGALWIRRHQREAISVEEIIAFVFSVLIIVAYTRTAGWYRYLFEAQAISLLFFPNALLVMARSMIHFINPKKLVTIIIGTLAVLGAYQVMFSSFVADSYQSSRTAFLEEYFAAVPSSTSFFFYNVPEVALFVHSSNYYQYFNPAGWYIGKEQLSVIEKGEVDTIIIETGTFAAMSQNAFALYRVDRTTHRYIMLQKK